MKMIAINTIHGAHTEPVLNKDGEPVLDSRKREKRRFLEEIIVRPGEAFESGDLGMDQDELDRLIASGAAKRKTREVPDDEPSPKPIPVAKNTAPRGPASGQTLAPDPAAVAAGTVTQRG